MSTYTAQELETMTPAQVDAAYLPFAQKLSIAEHRQSIITSDKKAKQEAAEAVAVAEAAVAPFEAEYDRRGGWTRAFLVQEAGGHVHSSTNCPSLHKGRFMTNLTVLPELSGQSEADIVTAAGWRACSICYPTAPIGDTHTLPSSISSKQDAYADAAREERAVAKAARDAKKKANAPTLSGEPLTVMLDWKEEFRTERAATIAYTDALVTYARYHDYNDRPLPVEGLHTIETALAEKHSTTVEEIRAGLVKKAQQKAKRENVAVEKVPTEF